MPPPETNRPIGETPVAEFPSTADALIRSEPPDSTAMPPPFDWAAPAWLSLTTVRTSVMVPQSSMPAASPNEALQGTSPGQTAFTLGTDVFGAARLPVTALWTMVTVVPGNASIPPPSAVAVGYPGPPGGTSGPQCGLCGLLVDNPPVMVRFMIVTVGVVVLLPMVTTGPPPTIL